MNSGHEFKSWMNRINQSSEPNLIRAVMHCHVTVSRLYHYVWKQKIEGGHLDPSRRVCALSTEQTEKQQAVCKGLVLTWWKYKIGSKFYQLAKINATIASQNCKCSLYIWPFREMKWVASDGYLFNLAQLAVLAPVISRWQLEWCSHTCSDPGHLSSAGCRSGAVPVPRPGAGLWQRPAWRCPSGGDKCHHDVSEKTKLKKKNNLLCI